MNFWNIKKIKNDLSNQNVNQRDLFAYYFLYGLIMALLVFPVDYNFFIYYQEESFKWIEWGSTNLIYLITIFLCYKANKGSRGNNFIERIFSLEVILTIRYFVFFLIPYEIFHLVFLEETAYSDIGNLFSMIIWSFLVSIRSVRCMNDIQKI
tara:strand:- start:162 stop:617 length:456 start_codon:yes stop_codon:yes gene_type:complete